MTDNDTTESTATDDAAETPDAIDDVETLLEALDEDTLAAVERELLAKMLAEFAYEDLLDLEAVEETDRGTRYELTFDDVDYRFVAESRLMDSYLVDEESIERRESGDAEEPDEGDDWEPATDPVAFLLDAHEQIGTPEMTVGHLVREYRNTLLADAHTRKRQRESDRDVAGMSYAELEGEMTGHPWITYNKGRLGWGYDDYLNYAPERKEPVQLSWLAVSKERSTFATVEGLSPARLLREELGELYETFESRLESRGRDPENYYFMPVHEWQWDNTVAQLYSKEIAEERIVPLGETSDEYLPAQSVRTFLNVDDPEKRNVKLPMRILNTLVWRGLPGDRTEAAPLVTEYVKGIRDDDEFLREECELVLPGEVAGVNYDHPEFARLDGNAYQYDELLGTVWRESVEGLVDDDERPVTLSALMHVDDGTPVVGELVDRSPLDLEAWLDELFATMLPPLLHYLYRYGTVFSPHGENTILILDEENVPTRLAVKDFVDDVNVSDQPLPELEQLPDELTDVLRREPPEGLCQFVFCGLFVCVYRYVSNVLTEHRDYPEEKFWTQVREAILDYQSQFPELEDRFETFDLLRPEFTKLCLNRNRMVNEGYGDAEGRPHAAEHGTVENALHAVAREESEEQSVAADD
ncbi:Siderophore synthetase component [Halogranum amylolyticum]|uniref:Siderophore synthetase component n=1 Tax=Halogranum amylolyticum TaxID=660520 RepID=A0A1H8RYL1_9EURY|nr:IucA/IucC family siderophore biosynthesis protein [Halogranum amylolyticum]SEO71376.1 Siderophore synthetase component [Halogranum amylolyticum]